MRVTRTTVVAFIFGLLTASVLALAIALVATQDSSAPMNNEPRAAASSDETIDSTVEAADSPLSDCVEEWNSAGNLDLRRRLLFAGGNAGGGQVPVLVDEYEGPAVGDAATGGAVEPGLAGVEVEPGDCIIVVPGNQLFAYVDESRFIPTTAIPTIQFDEYAQGNWEDDANGYFEAVAGSPVAAPPEDAGSIVLLDAEPSTVAGSDADSGTCDAPGLPPNFTASGVGCEEAIRVWQAFANGEGDREDTRRALEGGWTCSGNTGLGCTRGDASVQWTVRP